MTNIIIKWKFFCYLREQKFDREDELLSIVNLLEEIDNEMDRVPGEYMSDALWHIYCSIDDWLAEYYLELSRAEFRSMHEYEKSARD